MIFQGMLICVIFLTLFGLSLWPVLFKKSRHFKLVLISANIIFIVMMILFAGSVGTTQEKWQQKRSRFREEVLPATAALLEGTEKRQFTAIPETERDIQKIEAAIRTFSEEVTKK